MKKIAAIFLGVAMACNLCVLDCHAWDYEGHRFVNQLALCSLPTNFPAFVQTPAARERIAYLAGEPDRWRNTPELNHFNAPDHYMDLEELTDYSIDENALTPFRYDFTAQLALARAAHPERFKPIDAGKNTDHTRQLAGFVPWAIKENYDKLKSTFSYLKAFEKSGTPEEVANAQADAIYIMGVMGHYVGDTTQPLHTSKHYNGWNGENPRGYTTNKIHSAIDSYFAKLDEAGFAAMQARLHTAKPPGEESWARAHEMFGVINDYVVEQNKQVEPLYKLEKEGKLLGEPDKTTEGREFLTKQLLAGAQMLGDLWYSAWKTAPDDKRLEDQLAKRAHPPLPFPSGK